MDMVAMIVVVAVRPVHDLVACRYNSIGRFVVRGMARVQCVTGSCPALMQHVKETCSLVPL